MGWDAPKTLRYVNLTRPDLDNFKRMHNEDLHGLAQRRAFRARLLPRALAAVRKLGALADFVRC